MGFYSIYKIIKDIIRTLFGNKILKIILILLIIHLFILFFYQHNVFAISSDVLTTVTLNNSQYDVDLNYLTSQYNYYMLCWSKQAGGGSYYYSYLDLFCSNDEMTFVGTGNNTGVVAKSGSNLINFHVFRTTDSNYSFTNAVNTWNNIVFNPSLNTYTYSSGNGYQVTQTKTTSMYPSGLKITLANYDVKNANDEIVFNNNVFIPPSLSNSSTQLENLSFNNFVINANSFTKTMIENPDEPLVMLFYNRSLSNSNNTDGLYPIKEKYFYKESIYFDTTNSTDNNYIFNYPIFKTGIFFNIGSTYEIKFAKRVYIEEYDTYGYDYFDTNYVFTISSNVTQDYINQLNQQTATSTDEDNQEELNNSIQQQTQSIDNINNTITDSNVDTSSINLPTDNTTDPTQSGVDNIFQTIYNSFTSGTAQDIVFPIPNTNKNITLPANYTYNSLNNNNASWVINIIQAFYWYIISRYIIVDIMQKIRKIKQGNLDNIENSNIKEDML